jgi:predicted permease
MSERHDWKEEIAKRLASLKLDPGREAEIVDELSQHLEDRFQELLARGATEDQARRAALEELSRTESPQREKGLAVTTPDTWRNLLAEELGRVEREVKPVSTPLGGGSRKNFLADLWQDLRYGLRQLRRNPGFTAVAVLTLALGIGANTAIFSMVNGIMLRALPYAEPQQLYFVNEQVPQFIGRSPWGPYFPVNAGNFLLWQGECPAVSSMALIGPDTFNLTGKGIPRQVKAASVSAGFFSMMRIRLQLGRAFLPQEDQVGHDHEVIMTVQFWRQVFNSDPRIIGKSIVLDNVPYSVVGIMPESFRFPQLPYLGNYRPELFKPIGFQKWMLWSGVGGFNFMVIARLKRGSRPQQALAQINVVEARIARRGDARRNIAPGEFGLRATLRPLKTVIIGPAERPLWILMAAAGFVLLIICVNLANLILVRNAGRAHEVCVRFALGATAQRVARQFFAEGLILAAAGGGLGLLFAALGLQLLVRNAPVSIPRVGDIHLDLRVLLFTAGVSIVTALLFAWLPALRLTKVRPVEALKSAGPTASGTQQSARLRSGLVVGQIALCGVLVAGALLLIESLSHVTRANQWMDQEHVLAADLAIPPNESHTNQQATQFLSRVLEKVQALPGVRSAGFTSELPLRGSGFEDAIDFREAPQPHNKPEIGEFRFVSPGYFQAIGLRLVRGRFLSVRDRDKDVALISESVAGKLLPGRDPIGMHLLWAQLWPPKPREVIGEVADVRNVSDESPVLAIYLPLWTFYQTSDTLVVRTAMNPSAMANSVRRAVWSLDAGVAIPRVRTLKTVVRSSEATRRYETTLGALFAMFALLLAALGLYGVISYSVRQRTHEIGIRMALGAQGSDVLKMVLGDGLRLIVLGIAGGILGALVLTRLLSALLFGVKADNFGTLATVAFVLLVVGLLSTYIPARRATKVDPMVALRYE